MEWKYVRPQRRIRTVLPVEGLAIGTELTIEEVDQEAKTFSARDASETLHTGLRSFQVKSAGRTGH